MNFVGGLLITLGLVVFLIGYWFLSLSKGQQQCTDPAVTDYVSRNFGGGIAGIVIGLILMIIGIVYGNSDPIDIVE
jgi:multisubunit Na+/H+ antiporter MnhB subunit